jgi:hypothetical protein
MLCNFFLQFFFIFSVPFFEVAQAKDPKYVCEKSKHSSGLIFGGKYVDKGAYPW